MTDCNRWGIGPRTSGLFALAVASVLALLLTACGGGGGASSPTPSPAPAADLVLTGTAATGAAVAGATVDAKCAAGTGSSTTATDGSFVITINAGTLPCVLRVTSGTVVLHSVATTGGLAARANITPVTELVIARLAGDLPSAYYAGFTGASASSLTTIAVQTAALAVVETLRPGGIDFGLGADVLTGPLVAANGAVPGDAYDQRLDAFRASLVSAGMTVAQFSQAVATGSPAASVGSRTTAAALPAELLLAPAAPNCASLRSGKYRFVLIEDGGTTPATGIVTVDAPALRWMDATGGTQQLVATGPCTFTNADGGELFVNKAGIAITRLDGGTLPFHGAVLFPEQTHAVGELAGDYNTMAFDRSSANASVHLTSSALTLDSAGKVTTLNLCDDLHTCVLATAATLPNESFAANTIDGGFNLANTTAGRVDRAFAYRAGGGELMIVSLANAGHIAFMTRVVAVALPAVGRIQQFWNLFVNPDYSLFGLSQSKSTVTSVDATNGTYARNQNLNIASSVTRPETLRINSLRIGYIYRPGPIAVQLSDGSIGTVVEFVSLPLRGMDLAALALTAANQMDLAATEF